jgi:hypothetical protein
LSHEQESKLGLVALVDDVSRIAQAASRYAATGEEVVAVLTIEPAPGERIYLCAFGDSDGGQSWLALEGDGTPVTSRGRVRDAASIAAICEVAEESAGVPVPEEPRVASLSYLDSLGTAAVNGNFAAALQGAGPVVEELATDIVGKYKLELS